MKGLSRSLYTKLMALDERVFIGSFNDPFGLYLNTEIGVILDSPSLAKNNSPYDG